MSIPIRNSDRLNVLASDRTFFVTSSTFGKRGLLQSARAAELLVNVLYHYREQRKYLLHEFVIMPDHFRRPSTRTPAFAEGIIENQVVSGGKKWIRAKALFGLVSRPNVGPILLRFWRRSPLEF